MVCRNGKKLWFENLFPCGAARRCTRSTGPGRQSQGGDPAGVAGWGGGGVAPFLILEGFGAAERVGEKIRSLVLWKVRGTLPVRVLVSGHGIYSSLAEKSAKTVFF